MPTKNITINSLLVLLMLGLNSCSSDSDTIEIVETVITVSTSDFTTNINENPTNGEIIGIVTGTTNEGSITFSITEQSPNGAFAIDSNSGELTVANGAVFSFADNPIVTGVVEVVNGNVSENATITININETIIIVTTADFTESMDENPVNGQAIGVIVGTTNIGNVTFSITEQSPNGAFAIDADTGELTVANASLFDFEVNPTITGIVKVTNGSVFDNATITIDLNDVNEENIFNGNVTLYSQQDVDDFGANNYTSITGHLKIGNLYTSINDLNSLVTLTSIGSDLTILNNEELISLEGLNNLTSIGDYLAIFENNSLTNIDALNSLTSIGEEFFINNNNSLENIDGLSNTISLGGNGFAISSNVSLTNIDGLINLTSEIGGISISNCDSLTNLDGLINITTSTGMISVSNCPSLPNLNGLSNIISATGGISINDNDMLESLDALINISSNINGLFITENLSLTNINGLQNVPSVSDNIFINQNNSITNLDGLNEISAVDGNLFVTFNNTLTDLCGLQPLLDGGGLIGDYNVGGNGYNPTRQDIIDGNCSL